MDLGKNKCVGDGPGQNGQPELQAGYGSNGSEDGFHFHIARWEIYRRIDYMACMYTRGPSDVLLSRSWLRVARVFLLVRRERRTVLPTADLAFRTLCFTTSHFA